MAEKQLTPRIELSYLLKGQDRDSSSAMLLAGKMYAASRKDEEEFAIHFMPREKVTSIVYGRKVLQAMSYAEIDHEADEMQAEIEEHVAELGKGALLAHSRTGRQLSGPLPDQE